MVLSLRRNTNGKCYLLCVFYFGLLHKRPGVFVLVGVGSTLFLLGRALHCEWRFGGREGHGVTLLASS